MINYDVDLGDGTQKPLNASRGPLHGTAAAFYLVVYNVCVTRGAGHVSHIISLNITTKASLLLHVLLIRKLKVGQVKVTC